MLNENTMSPDNAVPINWIKKYAKENGPEVTEIIGYMLKEYLIENQKAKGI